MMWVRLGSDEKYEKDRSIICVEHEKGKDEYVLSRGGLS